MRLLTVTHYFESHRGGVELVAGRLAREFARAGVAVSWIAGDASPPPMAEPQFEPIPIAVWNAVERWLGIPYPIPGGSAWGRVVRAVRDTDVVLLHDSLYLTNIVAYLAARRFKRPVAVIQHIGEVPYRNPILRALMSLANRLIARPILGGADQVSFISEVTARYFRGVQYRRPAALVFNGVDIDLFRPTDPAGKAESRRRLGLPVEGPMVLFVGRFVEKKGLAYLEAAARARQDMIWAFAGWGPAHPAAWGLGNVRVFEDLGRSALAELYRAADVFTLPSAGEGYPLVVQEALASGLPVVCGAETVAADPIAAPYLIGVDLSLGDPATVGAAVGRAVDAGLAQPPDSTGRARFAAERYAWRQAAAQHLDLLVPLVGGIR